MPGIQNIDFLIALCLMLGAILYTSVGHAGSSVYIAIMSLFGVPVQVIKPTALVLNIIVSSYTSFRYIRAKLFDLKLYVPLAVGAISASAILTSGQGLTKGLATGALSAALYSAMEVGGPALASKVLARTVGATGLKNKASAAAGIRTLIDRVNRAPNREAALGLLNTYASSGSVPEE